MMHDAPRRAVRAHPIDCRCCTPRSPADHQFDLDGVTLLILAGFFAGIIIACLVDRLAGGPGISVIFGA